MKHPKVLPLIALLGAMSSFSEGAQACGGFFCGRQPVDQTAERILFEVEEDSVTMTTQISYNGAADDFAWILPLNAVPDVESLSIFPQRALTVLDANTGPTFYLPSDCYQYASDGVVFGATASGSTSTTGAPVEPPVEVHFRAEVGSYDVVVVESEDPAALITWLRDEGYRVTPPMEPYIELYTAEGMKFLALKLLETADAKDITPFRFTLPGDSPSIPLRMTALAAEPEMSIVVFVMGDQRYEAKNWQNLSIDDSQIAYDRNNVLRNNYAALVAQGVDAANGQGWVTEFAGLAQPYLDQVESQIAADNFATEEDEEAAVALAEVLGSQPYLTRFYARMSAEEMTLDPIFGRSAGDDVSNIHQLVRVVGGVDQCPDVAPATDPCAFVTCGAGGICRTVTEVDQNGFEVIAAACGCVPGATARTTYAPDGTATVVCQDRRMSFLNPGDNEVGSEVLPDTCATFDCGSNGQCVPVNLTPTCVCDKGYVATGSFDADGTRRTTCKVPDEPIPESFYQQRLPALPENTPGGITVDVPDPDASVTTTSSTASSTTGGTASDVGGAGGAASEESGGMGGKGGNVTSGGAGGTGGSGGKGGNGAGTDSGGSRHRSSCSLRDAASTSAGSEGFLLALVVALGFRRRRSGV